MFTVVMHEAWSVKPDLLVKILPADLLGVVDCFFQSFLVSCWQVFSVYVQSLRRLSSRAEECYKAIFYWSDTFLQKERLI